MVEDRQEFDSLLRKQRLCIRNADTEVLDLIDHYINKERNED